MKSIRNVQSIQNIQNIQNIERMEHKTGITGNYWLTLAVLLALSSYPLINGVRIAYISLADGVVEPAVCGM